MNVLAMHLKRFFPLVFLFLSTLYGKGPNIIYVICDDLGYGDVLCMNPKNGKIPTPHVDRLASVGMVFTDAHSGLWAYNLDFLKNRKYKYLANNFNFDQDFRFLCIFNKINIKEIFIKTKYGDERSQLHVIYALRFFYNSIKFFLFNKRIK